MSDYIYYFSEKEHPSDLDSISDVGIRGTQALEFAQLDLPILPGLIINGKKSSALTEKNYIEIRKYISFLEEDMGKKFGDPKNPLILKIVISPNLAITNYPALHNFGLCSETIEGFSSFVGENFAWHEVCFLLRGYFDVEKKIADLNDDSKKSQQIEKQLEKIDRAIQNNKSGYKKIIQPLLSEVDENFFDDAHTQLWIMLQKISTMLSFDDLDDDDVALIIQPMVYGNYTKDSASGSFYTRNIITGNPRLEGFFNQGEFDTIKVQGKDINEISSKYLKILSKMANTVEEHFKEIRNIRFTIENGRVWLIDQRSVMGKSTQSDIRTLLDLYRKQIVDDQYVIENIKPNQLNEILHPVIDSGSTKNITSYTGGIAGAPGAAKGRIFFSTDTLIEAYKTAQKNNDDTSLILCMPATYAEDVKAIEVSTGVLSNEGGYAAHASVVARQYGKVSLVISDMTIQTKTAKIGKHLLKEGDWITLNAPQYGDPQILFGAADLIQPDPQESGLLDFIAIVKNHIGSFHVRVNADKARDAELALKFGAEGIGLCRTEHMFFAADRINVFRQMIFSNTKKDREKVLSKLKKFQKKDFYDLFKVMGSKPVTIRLLDAPLHEFMPHTNEEFKQFMKYLETSSLNLNETEVKLRIEALDEFNPMLGHRGCRIAISYPEIYRMQMEAIFESVYDLQKEGMNVHPEIMIPLIMSAEELKMIIYGKKIEGAHYVGLVDIEAEICKEAQAEPVNYEIGTMIELPVAALGAGEIAKYAQFFSFGTNDLTQTTTGLSRDDYTTFMPEYTQFDIIGGNPFSLLNPYVKELVQTAVVRGTMTRPNLKKGLCGEHGAVPENIQFCIEAGLDYVSCSSYSVPIANLAIAQFNLKK